jgi:hypothetical protein
MTQLSRAFRPQKELRLCEVCGERKHSARGLCNQCYQRRLRNGIPFDFRETVCDCGRPSIRTIIVMLNIDNERIEVEMSLCEICDAKEGVIKHSYRVSSQARR